MDTDAIIALRKKHGFVAPKDTVMLRHKEPSGIYELGEAVSWDPLGFLGYMTADMLIAFDRMTESKQEVSEPEKGKSFDLWMAERVMQKPTIYSAKQVERAAELLSVPRPSDGRG